MSTINGADVIDYRQRLHLSRRELASSTGLTEAKIWRIEAKNRMSADEERALMLVGVSPTTDDGVRIMHPVTVPVATDEFDSAHVKPDGWDDAAIVVVEVPPEVAPFFESIVVIEPPAPEVNWTDIIAMSKIVYDHYFSNSEIQTFKRCRRKWWLAWFRGLHLKVESPTGVRQIGDRAHRALKAHYVPGGPPSGQALLDALEREIVIDRQRLSTDTLDETRKKFEDEANLERIILEGYLEWLKETGSDSDLEVIAPEVYLEAALDEFNRQIAIIGKLDVRMRRKSDGVHVFIDHKVVGDLTRPTRGLLMDEQMLHYHLLELLTLGAEGEGMRTDGALYNMLRRVKRTATANPPFYARVEVRHNDRELESFRRRLVGTIGDIMEIREQLEHGADPLSVVYPRPTQDCHWDCSFFSICPMFDDGSRVDAAIESYFTVDDPLRYYVEEMIGGIE
jgi:hypothetical protein